MSFISNTASEGDFKESGGNYLSNKIRGIVNDEMVDLHYNDYKNRVDKNNKRIEDLIIKTEYLKEQLQLTNAMVNNINRNKFEKLNDKLTFPTT